MQSLTRQIKRKNVLPVWNKVTFTFDFYKRIKSSGNYALTAYPYQNYPVRGPGITFEQVLALQKKNEYTEADKKNYQEQLKKVKKEMAKNEPGFFKRMFGKLFGNK